jgi:hypothetical protein
MLDESHNFLSGWMRVKIKLWPICPNTDLILTADEAVSECIGSAFFSLWKCAYQLQNGFTSNLYNAKLCRDWM